MPDPSVLINMMGGKKKQRWNIIPLRSDQCASRLSVSSELFESNLLAENTWQLAIMTWMLCFGKTVTFSWKENLATNFETEGGSNLLTYSIRRSIQYARTAWPFRFHQYDGGIKKAKVKYDSPWAQINLPQGSEFHQNFLRATFQQKIRALMTWILCFGKTVTFSWKGNFWQRIWNSSK